MNVTPLEHGRIEVNGHIDRMIQVESKTRRQYAMESESFTRTEDVGEPWDLKVGEADDGEEYVVTIAVEGSASPPKRSRVTVGSDVHVKIQHEVDDRRARGGRQHSIQYGGLEIGPDNEDQTHVNLETALTPYRGDSTVLFTKISFKDVRLREDSRGRVRMRATFIMDRNLAIGVQPSPKAGVTQIEGTMVVSNFERDITLRPGKTLRIRIPPQDGEEKYIDTDEVLELELDALGR
jgi:hypothetical protein